MSYGPHNQEVNTTREFQHHERLENTTGRVTPHKSLENSAATRTLEWLHEGKAFRVAYDRFGSGPEVLFLPAMSTVSTRHEWDTVARALAGQFAVMLLDWPGFGDSSRLKAEYSPGLFHVFLRDFVRSEFRQRVSVVAAGHGAGYVLRMASRETGLWSRAVLVAPTWRGPMPTAMGEHPKLYSILRNLVAIPGLGSALYRLNTSRWFLRRMYGRHVYANRDNLTEPRLGQKQRLARQRGARFASSAFVTGGLDPFENRAGCLNALGSTQIPVLLVFGEGTPPKSRSEMDALEGAGSHLRMLLPESLGLHEESAEALVAPLREFLSNRSCLQNLAGGGGPPGRGGIAGAVTHPIDPRAV